MQINPVQQASRRQLQDEVLSIIRNQATATDVARDNGRENITPDRPADAAADAVGSRQTDSAVREINQALKTLSTSLRFEVDDESGHTLVKVIDQDSGEVLRQIPSEATIRIARSLDKMVGHLVRTEA
ncbi:flagellar protein FlaG [Ramlibacter lithotrophicus]|nr:flagellar protein FlaG [Ramlibacter lithotrophicus]